MRQQNGPAKKLSSSTPSKNVKALKRTKAQVPSLESLEPRLLLSAPTTWTNTGIGGTGTTYVPSFNPSNPQEVWVGTDMNEAFHTTNFGSSWTEPNLNTSGIPVKSIPQYTSSGTLYAVCGATITKSTDDGVTWNSTGLSSLPSGESFFNEQFFVDATGTSPDRLIARGSGNHAYLSTNGGQTWSGPLSVPAGNTVTWIGGVLFDGNNIYMGVSDANTGSTGVRGLWQSTNNGAAWTDFNTGMLANEAFISVSGLKDGTGTYFMGLARAADKIGGCQNDMASPYSPWNVYYWKVGGPSTWTNVSSGITSQTPGVAATWVRGGDNGSGPVFYFASWLDGGNQNVIYKTADKGTTWTNVWLGNHNQNVATGYEGADGAMSLMDFNVDPNNPNYVVWGNTQGVYGTGDGGANWASISTTPAYRNPEGVYGAPNQSYGSTLNETSVWGLDFLSPNTIIEVNTDVDMKYSIDGGNTWATPQGIAPVFGSGNAWVYNTDYNSVTTSDGIVVSAIDRFHDNNTSDGSQYCVPNVIVASADKGATNYTLLNNPDWANKLFAQAMVGGIFQGANSLDSNGNFVSPVNLYTVQLSDITYNFTNGWGASIPSTAFANGNGTAFRYYRYLGPNGSWGAVGQIGFYNGSTDLSQQTGTAIIGGNNNTNSNTTRDVYDNYLYAGTTDHYKDIPVNFDYQQAFDYYDSNLNFTGYHQGAQANGSWVGLDLGASGSIAVTTIKFQTANASPMVKVIATDPTNANRLYMVVDGPNTDVLSGVWYSDNWKSVLSAGNPANVTWTHYSNGLTGLAADGNIAVSGAGSDLHALNDGTLVLAYQAASDHPTGTDAGVWVLPHGQSTWVNVTGYYVDSTHKSNVDLNAPGALTPVPGSNTWDMRGSVCLVVDPTDATQNTWYASVGWRAKTEWDTSCGLYRTTNRGTTWAKVSFISPANSFGPVAINPLNGEVFLTAGALYRAPSTSNLAFTQVTSFPFNNPAHVYFNPYKANQLWVCTFGNGAYYGDTTTTSQGLPLPPTSVAITTTSPTTYNLTWVDSTDGSVTGYKIEYAPLYGLNAANIENWQTQTTLGSAATSYSFSITTADVAYAFRVSAINSNGLGSAPVLTASIPTLPGTVTAMSLSATSVDVSWQDLSVSEKGFQVQYSPHGLNTWTTFSKVAARNATDIDVTGLASNTAYDFQVRAMGDEAGSSNWTSTAQATTQGGAGLYYYEGFDYSFSSLGYGGFMNNSAANGGEGWTNSATPFNPWAAGEGSGGGTVVNGLNFTAGGKALITLGNAAKPAGAASVRNFLQGNLTGTFWISVLFNENGGTGYSLTLGDKNTPNNVTSLSLLDLWNQNKWGIAGPNFGTNGSTIANGQVNLMVAKIVQGPTTDDVYVYGNPTPGQSTPNNLVVSLTNIPVSNTGIFNQVLLNGSATWDELRIGQNYIDVAPAAPSGSAPSAPTNFSAGTVTQTTVPLSWTDTSNNETDFMIEAATDSGFTHVVNAYDPDTTNMAGTGDVQNYTATGLTANTTYYFRIRAGNNGSYSSNCNASNNPVTTLGAGPSAPTNFSAGTVTQTTVALSWTDTSNNETDFKIDAAADSAFTNIVNTFDPATTNQAGTGDVQNYTATGLTANTTYYFRIRSHNASGDSANCVSSNNPVTTLGGGSAAVYDAFAYPTGNLNGQSGYGSVGWSNAWSCPGNSPVVTPGLAFAGGGTMLLTQGNDAIPYGTALVRDVTTPLQGSSFWISGVFIASNSAGAKLTICDSSTHGASSGISLGDVWGGSNGWMIATHAGAWQSFNVIPANASQFMVANVVVGSTDTVYLYADPTPGLSSPNNLVLTASGITLADAGTLNEIALAAGSGWDEIRIGSSYTAVAPSTTTGTGAPTSLSATPSSDSQINLTWSQSGPASSYNIYRSPDTGGAPLTFTLVGTSGSTSFSNTGLTAGTKYWYQVTAVYNSVESGVASAASATTLTVSIPSAPTSFSAGTVTQTTVYLSWTDTSNNETDFKIDAALDSAFTNIVNTFDPATTNQAGTGDVQNYTATGLTSNTTYYFRIRSHNAGGDSANCVSSNNPVTTLGGSAAVYDAFAYPTGNLNGQSGYGSVGWSNAWSCPGTSPVVTPGLAFAGGGTMLLTQGNDAIPYGTSLVRDVTTPLQGSSFWISGVFIASNSANAKLAIRDSSTHGASSGITIGDIWGGSNGWMIATHTNAWQSYNVVPANASQFMVANVVIGSTDTVYLYADPTPGAASPNNLVLTATGITLADAGTLNEIALDGGSGWDEIRIGSTYASVAPSTTSGTGAPTSLSATPSSNSQINLTWSQSGPASSYNIYRSPDTGGAPLTFTLVGTSGSTSFSNTGLTAGTKYWYQVTAVYNSVESGVASAASATTLTVSPPSAPTSVSAGVVGQTSLTLSWTDTSNNETDFPINQATNSTFTQNLVTYDPGTTNQAGTGDIQTFGVTGLSPNTAYYFQVAAHDGAGSSSYTNSTNNPITTLANVPTGLVATPFSQTQINLTWSESGTAASYKVYISTDGTTYNFLASNATTSYSSTGLTVGTQYWYEVTAINSAGAESAKSASANTVTVSSVYDSFGYPTGNLNGQSGYGSVGWSNSWSCPGNSPVVTPGLGYAGGGTSLLTQGNAAIPYGTALVRDLTTSLQGSSFWISGVFIEGSSGGSKLTIRDSSTHGASSGITLGDIWGGSNGWMIATHANAWQSYNVVPVNAAQFMVANVVIGSTDTVYLYADPTPGAASPNNLVLTASNITLADAGTLNEIALDGGSGWDEIRIGSTYASVAPVATTAPAAPTALAATASGTQINLTWSQAGTATSYKIYRSADPGYGVPLAWTNVGTSATTSFSDTTGLSAGTKYWYEVTAVYNSVESGAYSLANATTGLSGNLKAYWRLDEKVGTSAADSSTGGATADTGTLNGSPTWATGKIGNALTLNGTSQYVQAANSNDLNITTNTFSIACWVKSGATNWNSTQTFVSKGSQYKFGGVSGGKNIQFSLYIGGAWTNLTYTNAGDISTSWHHYAATYDGTNMRIWVDGTNVATVAKTGNIASDTNVLYIGRQASTYLSGSIDEVRIYNATLAGTDISAMYNQANLSITGLTTSGSHTADYSVQSYNLNTGISQYGNVTKNFTTVPTKYLGSSWIKTSQADNNVTGVSNFLTFTTNTASTVYVMYDDAIASKPSWLTSKFTDTGDNIVTQQGTFSVYALTFAAGVINLGSNLDSGSTTGGMYNVLVVPVV